MTAIEQSVQQVRRKPGTAPRAASRMARRQALLGLLFVSPWIIGFVIFKLLPILASLVFSFTNFHAMERESIQFIGLDNYWRLLSDNQAGFSLFSTLSFGLRVIPAQLGVRAGASSYPGR